MKIKSILSFVFVLFIFSCTTLNSNNHLVLEYLKDYRSQELVDLYDPDIQVTEYEGDIELLSDSFFRVKEDSTSNEFTYYSTKDQKELSSAKFHAISGKYIYLQDEFISASELDYDFKVFSNEGDLISEGLAEVSLKYNLENNNLTFASNYNSKNIISIEESATYTLQYDYRNRYLISLENPNVFYNLRYTDSIYLQEGIYFYTFDYNDYSWNNEIFSESSYSVGTISYPDLYRNNLSVLNDLKVVHIYDTKYEINMLFDKENFDLQSFNLNDHLENYILVEDGSDLISNRNYFPYFDSDDDKNQYYHIPLGSTTMVYNSKDELVNSFEFNNLSNNNVTLIFGTTLIYQNVFDVPDDSQDYDYMLANDKQKRRVETFTYNVITGEAKEIDFDYVIVRSNTTLENVALVDLAKIENYNLSSSYYRFIDKSGNVSDGFTSMSTAVLYGPYVYHNRNLYDVDFNLIQSNIFTSEINFQHNVYWKSYMGSLALFDLRTNELIELFGSNPVRTYQDRLVFVDEDGKYVNYSFETKSSKVYDTLGETNFLDQFIYISTNEDSGFLYNSRTFELLATFKLRLESNTPYNLNSQISEDFMYYSLSSNSKGYLISVKYYKWFLCNK